MSHLYFRITALLETKNNWFSLTRAKPSDFYGAKSGIPRIASRSPKMAYATSGGIRKENHYTKDLYLHHKQL